MKVCVNGKAVVGLPFSDVDMAWDNFEDEFSVWSNGDGTVDIEAYGHVLLKGYRPENCDVGSEEGWLYGDVVECLWQELVFEKNILSLCDD